MPLGRALAWFWLATLAVLGGVAVILQILGPPARPISPHGGALHAVPPDALGHAAPVSPARTVAAPLAALQEPVVGIPGIFLPRIGADGRLPRQVYAAPFEQTDRRPRIGILLAGMGLNSADSSAAITGLPGGVTLAFSPYAQRTAPLLEAARARGHEYLVSLPLEPSGAPLHDAGHQALLVGALAEQNRRRLDWSLSQIGGYVGATGALGALRGERFAAATEPMREMTQALAARGLLYIDPRPGAATLAGVAGRGVDLVIDSVQLRTEIGLQLRQLERIAREHGSALGLAGAPLPVTVGLLATWAGGLAERGFALAPVSALLATPSPTASRPAEPAH